MMRHLSILAVAVFCVAVGIAVTQRMPAAPGWLCGQLQAWSTQSAGASTGASAKPGACERVKEAYKLGENIYSGGLVKPWADYGWAKRNIAGPGPAEVRFNNWGGWIIAHTGSNISADGLGAFVFRVKAPRDFGDFLEVRLAAESGAFEAVAVTAAHRLLLEDGWVEVLIPMSQLNPYGGEFKNVRFRANKKVPLDWVLLDNFGFTGPRKDTTPKVIYPERRAAMVVHCEKPTLPISPNIYGIAAHISPKGMGATAHRMGGNRMTRYNWEIGAINTGSDWYFRNVPHHLTHQEFIEAVRSTGGHVAMTVPIMGWVAKDKLSYSFPVKALGAQRKSAPENRDMGNGVSPSGDELPSPNPHNTSIEAPPRMIRAWIDSIRKLEKAEGTTLVHEYILDNEPALWNSTHRDVHPNPLTYDELLDRTVRYGSTVRAAAPDAIISGPAVWGWPAYFYSAKDASVGFRIKPDRRAHGDVPLLEWYLRKLRAHERKTSVRILDVLDIHYYPQAKGLYSPGGGSKTDAKGAALRLRATRSLWDPTYVDESWIGETIELIPRMKRIIAKNYPGLGVSIGEWNFGAEKHISGGLAVAEALGRFAEQGLRSAYYWTKPDAMTPAYWGFRAYRNFDGEGGHFLDSFVRSFAPEETSLFVSHDKAARHMVAVALNLSPDYAARAALDTGTCGEVKSYKVYRYSGGAAGFKAREDTATAKTVSALMPPHSMAVFDIRY